MLSEQIESFLSLSGVSGYRLALTAGISRCTLWKFLHKQQSDIASRRADALRKAMWELDPEAAEKALGHGPA